MVAKRAGGGSRVVDVRQSRSPGRGSQSAAFGPPELRPIASPTSDPPAEE
jgi:hypothetical protein